MIMVTRIEQNFNRNILNHLREDGLDMMKAKHNRERYYKNIDHRFSCRDIEEMEVKETEEIHLDFAIA